MNFFVRRLLQKNRVNRTNANSLMCSHWRRQSREKAWNHCDSRLFRLNQTFSLNTAFSTCTGPSFCTLTMCTSSGNTMRAVPGAMGHQVSTGPS